MIVVGVDVGLRVNGYVVCRVNPSGIELLRQGEIKTVHTGDLSKRLFVIYEKLRTVIETHHPEAMVVEELYSHHRHPTTISLLAQVRGVVLLLAQQHGLKVHAYSPTRARKSFVGRGSADSGQVKKMADNILGREMLSCHTADAFSLVVAFSHEMRYKRFVGALQPGKAGSGLRQPARKITNKR